MALQQGVAVSLAGGTHHAFRDRGAGDCVFDEAAIAALAMQAEGQTRRVPIVDCDVHQGDGTTAKVADDLSVFTSSIHGAGKFPFRKIESDLDVALPDFADGNPYLWPFRAGLCHALPASQPGLVIYLAGAPTRSKVTVSGGSRLVRTDSFVATNCCFRHVLSQVCRLRPSWLMATREIWKALSISISIQFEAPQPADTRRRATARRVSARSTTAAPLRALTLAVFARYFCNRASALHFERKNLTEK